MFSLIRFGTFAIIASLLPLAVLADQSASASPGNCWVEAGVRYDVNPWLLYAIGIQESSLEPLAVNENPPQGSRPGSKDVGLLQINSFWFDALSEIGISESALYDPCLNIHVGAWILAQNYLIYGKTWDAVGAYNAGTAKTEAAHQRRQKYADSVRRIYERVAGSL
ncbi:MAG: lytic transglycosylase domain-containing protein [Pseudomonadales bacterium]|nr:lytic transglycosylase domain-containing protein [Pseudomonadales bacterium]